MGTVAAQREAGLLPTGGEAVAGNRGFQKTPVPTLRDMGAFAAVLAACLFLA